MKNLTLLKNDFCSEDDWFALCETLELDTNTVEIELKCSVCESKSRYIKMLKAKEDMLVEKISNDSVENIEDFLGYPISDIVLEELDVRLREVIHQMPEEELSKFEKKYLKTSDSKIEENPRGYNKPIDEPLIFIECLQLLDVLIKNNIIIRDSKNENNILVYREKGTKEPEGWYSENIHSVARGLLGDIEGQKYLRNLLEEKGIEKPFTKVTF